MNAYKGPTNHPHLGGTPRQAWFWILCRFKVFECVFLRLFLLFCFSFLFSLETNNKNSKFSLTKNHFYSLAHSFAFLFCFHLIRFHFIYWNHNFCVVDRHFLSVCLARVCFWERRIEILRFCVRSVGNLLAFLLSILIYNLFF